MYNIDDEALSASSSTPDSYPHYAKLFDLSSFARKGIKTQKMERIEQIQQEADHIGELGKTHVRILGVQPAFCLTGGLKG